MPTAAKRDGLAGGERRGRRETFILCSFKKGLPRETAVIRSKYGAADKLLLHVRSPLHRD